MTLLNKLKSFLFGEISNEEIKHELIIDKVEFSEDFIEWFRYINRL